jgi:hypothetical protein
MEKPMEEPHQLRPEIDNAGAQKELERDKALARYDAHPGIAVALLAVMAFLFIVISYQFVSDRLQNPPADPRHSGVEVQPRTSPR